MNCRNCGKEITDNVKFCSKCGEQVLYEIEVIEPGKSLIELKNKDASEIQNEEILNGSNDSATKCKRRLTNKKIIIQKIVSFLVGLVFLAWMNSYYHQKQDEELQEKLDVSYSLGVESLSKGDFKKAEKEFSAFGENPRVISRETDYVVASKHYQDAYILRYYADAGKDFEEGTDSTYSLDKIPNNYSGLFSQEINNLKRNVKEMKEKVAAEKEAAEREKKRKEEGDRQRIAQEQERKQREAIEKAEAERRESNNSGVSPSRYQTPFGHVMATIPKLGQPILKIPNYVTSVVNHTMQDPRNGQEIGKREIRGFYNGIHIVIIVEAPTELVTSILVRDEGASIECNAEVVDILKRQYGRPSGSNQNWLYEWNGYLRYSQGSVSGSL